MHFHNISLNSLSPYIRYVNDVSFCGPYYGEKRIIYDHEFIFPVSGAAYLIYDDKTYHLTPGALFHLSPNLGNQLIVKSGSSFRAHCIHFDWLSLDEKYDFTAEQFYIRLNHTPEELLRMKELKERPNYELSDFTIPSFLEHINYSLLLPLFQELYFEYLNTNIISMIKNKATFLKIVAEIIAMQQTKENKSNTFYHDKIIKQSIIYIQEHYPEKLTTRYFAEYYGISPKYYGTIFKEITGTTFQNCLLDIRIQQAKQLLVNTSLPILSVSEKVGIEDVYYFTKLFHKNVGITPARFRKAYSV